MLFRTERTLALALAYSNAIHCVCSVVVLVSITGVVVDALQPGDPQWVGRYRLLRRLGTGGMGRVYLGQSPGGRLVAVKLIRPELADDPGFRRRFADEVNAARRVSGIFTAPVVDADPDGVQPWLVTAYVAGPSLADAVEAQGPMPVESVLTLAAGLAEGLGAVHAAGVVHRDLKPSNVLLASDGPRIIDFGISRATDSAWLTNAGGVVVGSPGFMSPEQAEGRYVGPPTDIFSLGGVLAYAATGLAPFGAGPASALLYRVVYGTAATGHVPPPLRRLVERCLAKNPADRPSTEELLAELGYAEPGEDWLTWPAAAVRPASELASTQLDQAARRASGSHEHINGNGVVPASAIPPQRGRPDRSVAAAGNPAQANSADVRPAGRHRASRNPAGRNRSASSVVAIRWPEGDPAGGHPAGGNAAASGFAAIGWPEGDSAEGHPADGNGGQPTEGNPAGEPVTAPRSARHSPSSALIGAAVAAVLAAGTAGAVAYVVASDHDHASLHAGAGAQQAQVRADNRNQDSAAGAEAPALPPGPLAVVDSYFAAINHRDWRRVWRLGGEASSPSYSKMIDDYSSIDKDVIRAISVTGNHAVVQVRAYEADGQSRLYQMYFVISDGVIVRATQQLLRTVPDGGA
jgi:Protein kinase domain